MVNLAQPTSGWDGPIGTDANRNDFLIGQEFTLPGGNYELNLEPGKMLPSASAPIKCACKSRQWRRDFSFDY